MSFAMSEAGASTVVGQNDHGRGKPTEDYLGISHIPSNGQVKAGPDIAREVNKEPFVIATDYMDENRPYFVKVGKDGVLPAIQKLDLEMRNVGLQDIVPECR